MNIKELFSKQVEVVLTMEGGFSDHKSDVGGATMYGISSKANPEVANKIKSKTLTLDEAKDIYYRKYFLPSNSYSFYQLGFERVGFISFDCKVTGSSFVVRELQSIISYITGVNLKTDGILGKAALDALSSVKPENRTAIEDKIIDLMAETAPYCARRIAQIVMGHQARLGKPIYDYSKGFLNRMKERLAYA